VQVESEGGLRKPLGVELREGLRIDHPRTEPATVRQPSERSPTDHGKKKKKNNKKLKVEPKGVVFSWFCVLFQVVRQPLNRAHIQRLCSKNDESHQ
jgi:hypothetical protein